MIRQLLPADAEAYFALRSSSLLEAPLAFTASPEDDVAGSVEATRELLARGPESVVFGAFAEDTIAGAVGLHLERQLKRAHIATIWGMYVAPAFRGRGIAAGLINAVVQHASGLPDVQWVQLSVNETAPEAQRVYERAGFRVWGTEPAALRHGGRSTAEHHMALGLRER